MDSKNFFTPILFLLFFFVNKINSNGVENIISSAQSSDSDKCMINNPKYWKIIEEFYKSTKLISLYFIHPNEPSISHLDLLSVLLEQFPKSEFRSKKILYEHLKDFFLNKSVTFFKLILFFCKSRTQLFSYISNHRHGMWMREIII